MDRLFMLGFLRWFEFFVVWTDYIFVVFCVDAEKQQLAHISKLTVAQSQLNAQTGMCKQKHYTNAESNGYRLAVLKKVALFDHYNN